jgi:signal peptidase I
VADVALAAGLAVLAAVVLRAYVVRTFSVDSASMRETLRPGDRVLADRVTYRLREVRRGDLVVLRRPTGAGIPEEELVKRVIGLPGERVAARDGAVSVDGVPLREPYAGRDCPLARVPADPVLVPAGHLYVLGDDRCRSLDSRELGPVDDRLVEGRIFGIVWPLGRMGRF